MAVRRKPPCKAFGDLRQPGSFASESYSKEELIAELAAAMLCGIAGSGIKRKSSRRE
jgi:hypothetical protein